MAAEEEAGPADPARTYASIASLARALGQAVARLPEPEAGALANVEYDDGAHGTFIDLRAPLRELADEAEREAHKRAVRRIEHGDLTYSEQWSPGQGWMVSIQVREGDHLWSVHRQNGRDVQLARISALTAWVAHELGEGD